MPCMIDCPKWRRRVVLAHNAFASSCFQDSDRPGLLTNPNGFLGGNRTRIAGLGNRGPVHWTTRKWHAMKESNPHLAFRRRRPYTLDEWRMKWCSDWESHPDCRFRKQAVYVFDVSLHEMVPTTGLEPVSFPSRGKILSSWTMRAGVCDECCPRLLAFTGRYLS